MEGYDVLISEDDHDVDVAVVAPRGSPLRLVQRALPGGTRMDVIEVPEDVDQYDALEDAFQPVSWFLSTEGIPVTGKGVDLVRRLRSEVDPRVYASHMRAVAWCFIHGEDWCPGSITRKSWRVRRGRAPLTKQAVPVYRVSCDLLPKALYAEETGRLPLGRINALSRYPDLMEACALALKALKGAGGHGDLERSIEILSRRLKPPSALDVEAMRSVMGRMLERALLRSRQGV